MRRPDNESSFFQRIKNDTQGSIYWERIEPKTEGGFPDTHFVLRNPNHGICEGTVEFKFCKTKTPNLKTLMKPSQKASILEYFPAGGRRRFTLVCNVADTCFLYNTQRTFYALLSGDMTPSSSAFLEDSTIPARLWLPQMLEFL